MAVTQRRILGASTGAQFISPWGGQDASQTSMGLGVGKSANNPYAAGLLPSTGDSGGASDIWERQNAQAARERDAVEDMQRRSAGIQTQSQRSLLGYQSELAAQADRASRRDADRLRGREESRASMISEREAQDLQSQRDWADSQRRAQEQAQQALLRLQGDQRQAEQRLQEQLLSERETRRRAAIPSLLSSVPGIDESQYQTTAVDEGEEAANTAAFTRAREQAGASGLGAVRALREMMAGQGLHGSSVEAAGLGGVIGDVRGTVGEVGRTEAIRRSQRAGQRADRDVNVKLTRRSQDIARQQALQQLILGSIY